MLLPPAPGHKIWIAYFSPPVFPVVDPVDSAMFKSSYSIWRTGVEGKLILVAAAIMLAGLLAAWEFRYSEEYHEFGRAGKLHRNRITGVACLSSEECWFESDLVFRPQN